MKPGRRKAPARDIRVHNENIPGRMEFVQPTKNCCKTGVEKEVHGSFATGRNVAFKTRPKPQ